MSTVLFFPMAISAIAGLVLLIWSFFEHIRCKGAYEEKHIGIAHSIFMIALFVSAGIVVYLAVGKERSVTLFYLMKNIPIYFKIDEVSRWFVLIVTVVWVLVGIYSIKYLHHEGEQKRFLGFFLLVYSVLIGLDFSGNLVTMYLFYELMTLTSFPLVLHNGSKEAIMAALKYLFYSMAGAYMGLFGIFYLQHMMGDLTFVAGGAIGRAFFDENKGFMLVAVFIMILGFAVKAGLCPLHAWLPTAHPVAPSPASAVLSGIIVKSGVLAIIRVIFYLVGPEQLRGTWVITVFLIMSLVTVFMGSLLAFREPVLKKRLAYSTVSQVSYILFGIFLLTPKALTGALLQVAFHAIVKCGLFLVAGIFLYEHNVRRVDELVGIGRRMPVTLWSYTFLSLSLIGIPPMSGFVSKWFLAQGALVSDTGLFEIIGPVVLLVSALLTAGYLMPITMKGFFPGEEAVSEKVKETSLWMLVPIVVLAVLAFIFGVLPNGLIDYADKIAALQW